MKVLLVQQPLKWPQGRPNTLIGARVDRKAWKLNLHQYKDRLDTELVRMKVRAATLTMNDANHRNPAVALYFMRPPVTDDFSWQDTLGISNPDPTREEIETKHRELIRQFHSDVPGTGDKDLAAQLNVARDRAIAYITGNYGKENELAIGIDRFTEQKWNIAAIAMTLNYLRRLEEIGAPDVINRAYAGFRAELTEGAA